MSQARHFCHQVYKVLLHLRASLESSFSKDQSNSKGSAHPGTSDPQSLMRSPVKKPAAHVTQIGTRSLPANDELVALHLGLDLGVRQPQNPRFRGPCQRQPPRSGTSEVVMKMHGESSSKVVQWTRDRRSSTFAVLSSIDMFQTALPNHWPVPLVLLRISRLSSNTIDTPGKTKRRSTRRPLGNRNELEQDLGCNLTGI